MDLHNNEVGIQYCSNCYPGYTTDQTISNGIMQLLLNGSLNYLDPLSYPVEYPNYGIIPCTGSNSSSCTKIIPTNQ
ncbi:MAG: hypothetical protein GX159_11755 [Flavobacteriaceae bacterium]|jgi:hypothetical protein|nr:hypothetical protein [Flavobacteriaceae bacterium]